MVVSGLVLQIEGAAIERVCSELAVVPGVSGLQVVGPTGPIVCVLETETTEGSTSVVGHLREMEGVYSVMPAYIHEVTEEDDSCN